MMHKVIRGPVFETNSSSTHSVTIVGGTYIPDKFPLTDGVCVVYPGEFGWEEMDYNDCATKASYALVWAKSCKQYKVDEEDRAIAMLIKVLSKQTGSDVRFQGQSDKRNPWGYIDHQSIEEGGPGAEIFVSEAILSDFIFNRKSILKTDNDNK